MLRYNEHLKSNALLYMYIFKTEIQITITGPLDYAFCNFNKIILKQISVYEY